MNDQDKEAFEKWCTEKFNIAPELVEEFKHTFIHKLRHTEEAWQSACEYKQKVIDKLESENTKLITDTGGTYGEILFGGKRARQVLKELEK